MTSLGIVNGNGQVGFRTFDFAGLSPDMMLAFMQSNMQSLDHQIAGILDDMNARRAEMAQLNEAQRALRLLKADVEGEGVDLDKAVDAAAQEAINDIKVEYARKIGAALQRLDPDTFQPGDGRVTPQDFDTLADLDLSNCPQIEAMVQDALEAIEPYTVRGTLESAGLSATEISNAAGDDGRLSDEDIDELVKNLDSRLSELNDTTEYDSMRVGALMNKRSQMIQLTSNIMREMNETSQAVIQNI